MKKIQSLFGVLALVMAFFALTLSAPAEASNKDGYFNWSRVGASAVKRFQGGDQKYQDWARSQVLSSMGFNAYETSAILEKFNSTDCIKGSIRAGDEFERGSFLGKNGKPMVTGKVRLTDKSEESFEVCRVYLNAGQQINGYTLTRDITVTLVYKCANVVIERRPPPAPKPPVVPEVIKIPVPPVTVIPPAPKPPVVPTPEADKFCDNVRINAVAGVELELADGWARSVYGAWGIYCMKRLKNGNQIGFGPAGQMAVYGGDPGNGHFKGHFIASGVGMMYVDRKGQDVEAKLMVGEYKSDYRNDDGYRMRERHPMLALSVAHNDYRGVIKGTGKERQIFGMLGLPIGGSATEAWPGYEGKASELNLYYNAGIRQFLNKENTLYVQGGILGELRSGEDYFSCSLRVGYANKSKTFGVHAGVNACDGGIAPAIGAWVDFGQMIRKGRAKKRAAAIAPDLGNVGQPTTEVALVPLASTLD